LQLVLCDALVGVNRTDDALVLLRRLSEVGQSSADAGRALVRLGAVLHSLSRYIPAYAALKRGCMVLEVSLGKYSSEFVRWAGPHACPWVHVLCALCGRQALALPGVLQG
jgi:hypothetical protein